MRSIADRPWSDPTPLDPRSIASLSGSLRLSRAATESLLRRGLTSSDAISRYLRPSVNEVNNPYAMKGMKAVADRVRAAITGHERILIFGDYDADGIPGVALLANWMLTNGAAVATFIPNREDGYGMSAARAKELLTRFAPQVVITVDLGSSDHDAIRILRAGGADVIITDHHLTLKGIPPTPYFINTSRSDGETYPTKGVLCGCGTAYKLIQAISSKQHEPRLYDLVALSTVGDQVPLIGENRFFVRAALDTLHSGTAGNLGIRALVNIASKSLSTLTATDIGWIIAPRINAVGRMGADPNLAVSLLMTSDTAEAARIANQMNRLNGDRQELTARLYENALDQVDPKSGGAIVVYLPDATVGVAGLVAARVVEAYGRPTLVVNGEGRGSGRAPEGGSIMKIMDQLRSAGVFGSPRKGSSGEMVTPDFGGHEGACGFHNVDPASLSRAARSVRVDRVGPAPVQIDAIMTLPEIDTRFTTEMEAMEPFGVGNPEPHFLVRGVTVAERAPSKTGTTLLFTVTDGTTSRRAYWFGGGSQAESFPSKIDLLMRPTIGRSGDAEMYIYAVRPAK